MIDPTREKESAAFDLESAIERWARSLRRQSAIEDGDAADLEGYLRDKVEDLVAQGLSGKEAFERAAAEFTAGDDLGEDFYRSRTTSRAGSRPPGKAPRFVPALFWNTSKIALRKARKQKAYSFINIAGLAVGLAACLLILVWVKDELSYDRYHEQADRVFRVAQSEEIGGVPAELAVAPFVSAPAFAAEIPEVETYARLLRGAPLAVVEGRKFDLTDIYFTDPGFFDLFSHVFLTGDRKTALAAPGALVLTEETARRLFGAVEVVGRTVNFNNDYDLKVTAVVKNVPANSHFLFNGLVSLATVAARPDIRSVMEDWFRISGWVYVLLRERADPRAVEAKMAALKLKHVGDSLRQSGSKMDFRLQPLTDIHLRSRLEGEIGPSGDIRYVYVFSLIAAFILVLACINFMNLATARSAARGKEVGLRKVMGARRGNLILQFLGESVLMSILASVAAVVLVVLALPSFNRLAGKAISPASLLSGSSLLALAGLVLLTGFLGGSYPALFMSAFRPVVVLRGNVGRGLKRASFRSLLVVFQFSVSVVLMAGTLIALSQTRYMKTRDLGFDKDQVLVINMRDAAARRSAEALAGELKSNANIGEAALSSGVPGRVSTSLVVGMEGRPERESFPAWTVWSDYDFVKTYGISIVAGRDFARSFASDAGGVFLVNETAALRMGWGLDAVGRKIGFDTDDRREIVGVLKDFHFGSLRNPIEPLVVRLAPAADLARQGRFLSLKLRQGDIPALLAFAKAKWAERSERGFDFFFADENFDSLYRNEVRVGRIITAFAVMAVFVACLGLFGLASFAAEQRTKEIGVRKVLGASEAGLAALLSREFLKWVLLANAVALPAAHLLMERFWLASFAYRSTPGILLFASVAALSLVIALLTVSGQAIRASVANPVESLRYE
ncbi:MAG: ABC transporter permease [Candidatus Aminicenantes bacterium]|nr:ABC transporter permease [Candidatus Aminicenantes bacterium]